MNPNKFKDIVFSMATSGLLLVGLFMLLNGSAQLARANPGNLFVTANGNGINCTQANPCDLATALSQSGNDDTIYVAQGTFTGTSGAVITLTKSITLFGGWDATAVIPPVRNSEMYPTILNGEDARRVVYISGNITPTLDGFVITQGNASEAAIDPGYGGGIYSNSANPIFTHNVISGNVASNNPVAWGFGGGICILNPPGMAIVSKNRITNNSANTANAGDGGGVAVRGGNGVTVSENTFQGNLAGLTTNSNGGGLSLYNSPAVVSGNLLQDNQAAASGGGFGGGLYSQFGDVTLSANIVADNAAEYGSVTFQQNPNITLVNNIIARNSAGGVFVRGSVNNPLTGSLVNNTIAQNGREGVYAGWYVSGYSKLTLTNNIIVSHSIGIFTYPALNSNIVTATKTLFFGNGEDTGGSTITSTEAIIESDPLFVDSAGWDYHLRVISPAIDAGESVPWLTTDMDGDVRPWPVGGYHDIGADEVYWRRIYLPQVLKSSG